MGEGSILEKLGRVRLQSTDAATDAATNAVDTAMYRTGQIPHGLETGLKQVILLRGKQTFQPLPTAEPEVRRDHQQLGETGGRWSPTIQGKGQPASEEGLRVIPEPLLQVATELSSLLPGAEALQGVLSELLLWVGTDPWRRLLPRTAEALLEALPVLLKGVATDPSALLREA